jgi:hypothetical protein
MILKFPDLDTLRLALTTGAVPPAVSQAAAIAGLDGTGPVWVDTPAPLPKAAQNDLRRLGVVGSKVLGGTPTPVRCWPQILPLVADADLLDRLDQTTILFELAGGERFARFVAEVLRLGNDRQFFRWLAGADGADRALLRVAGPPYYSLLRALDRAGADGPVAYRERASRVWVEVGWTHPLAERVKPPAGKLLLLRPPRQWTLLDDAPFRDAYEVIEFTLPAGHADWNEGKADAWVRVTPTLTAGGSTDGAELWVLRDDPVAELNRFVQNADDQLLHRLAFAVGERDGRKTVVLRVRPSKLPPPVLVLKGDAYKHYLKLPNLFLPAGTRLHPPLRRDRVRDLLAPDPDQLVWLAPSGERSFTPVTLPENAFRPLIDWVDYVLDHEQEALTAWVQAAQFDFEAFVCDEDAAKVKKPPPPPEKHKSERKRGDRGADEAAEALAAESADKPRKSADAAADDKAFAVARVEPSEAEKRRRALEEQFLALEGGMDAPGRQALWPELAAVNAAVANTDEAGVCWMNALWSRDDAPAAWEWEWFRIEASGVPAAPESGLPRGRSWATRASSASGADRDLTDNELEGLLKLSEPKTADLRALAAHLTWAGRRPAPRPLADRLNRVRAFLEEHERLLPVRALWLAWLHLARLAGGDVLALARARDRLLERLYHNGLRPEQDLPGFLRFAGQPTSQRFRDVRQWLTRLCALAREWVVENGSLASPPPPMGGYTDLVFAFGLARLGEHEAASDLLRRAAEELGHKGEPHSFLLQAFDYRVRQVLAGKPHGGPLPAEYLEYLEAMEKQEPRDPSRLQRYVADRMRNLSRIVEPDQELDPYRHWGSRTGDLEKALAELPDLADVQEVVRRVQGLWQGASKGEAGNEARAMILREALNQAPRVGEEFARELLDLLPATYDALPEPQDEENLRRQAEILERGLFTAGHFDRTEHIHPLTARFQKMLDTQTGRGEHALKAINAIAGKCFRSLRKLGFRDEIDRLLTRMAEVVLEGQDLHTLDPGRLTHGTEAMRTLLQVAGGWLYFGREQQAQPVMQAARAVLFREDLDPIKKAALACSYATAVGQASIEIAQKRLEELFTRLRGVRDGFTTKEYYTRSQFQVIEAVVLAVAGDDFALGADARRWLDDDEYLVRRRVHKDLRTLAAHAV